MSHPAADAARRQAEECLSELCEAWDKAGKKIPFPDRVAAAETLHILGALMRSAPRAKEFYERMVWLVWGSLKEFDHAATELIYLIFGNSRSRG